VDWRHSTLTGERLASTKAGQCRFHLRPSTASQSDACRASEAANGRATCYSYDQDGHDARQGGRRAEASQTRRRRRAGLPGRHRVSSSCGLCFWLGTWSRDGQRGRLHTPTLLMSVWRRGCVTTTTAAVASVKGPSKGRQDSPLVQPPGVGG
jgi:hypothetical protein